MDKFEIDSGPTGTLVRFGKYLPRGTAANDMSVGRVASDLARSGPEVLVEEVLAQNRDLLTTMADLETARAELSELNAELDSTNRGVLALYAELEQRADELKRASEVKSQFLSAVSHELRTPLNSITALTPCWRTKPTGRSTRSSSASFPMSASLPTRSPRLVNDLLDLAKVEAGRIRRATGQGRSLRAALGPARHHEAPADQRGGGSRLPRPYRRPPALHRRGQASADPAQPVSNALKYNRARRGQRHRRHAGTGPGRVRGARQGIGIPDQERERIFDEFVQIRNPLQTRTKGSGLGLPLSRKLAGIMGWVITVESEAGKGSTFTLDLPTVLPGTSLESVVAAEAMGKVLIVDDEESTRYVLTHMLRSEGPWALIEAADGTEGLRLAQAEMPDFILLDLHLPGLTGFEVFGR